MSALQIKSEKFLGFDFQSRPISERRAKDRKLELLCFAYVELVGLMKAVSRLKIHIFASMANVDNSISSTYALY